MACGMTATGGNTVCRTVLTPKAWARGCGSELHCELPGHAATLNPSSSFEEGGGLDDTVQEGTIDVWEDWAVEGAITSSDPATLGEEEIERGGEGDSLMGCVFWLPCGRSIMW